MANKENIKAWLGLNIQDTLLNVSAIPFVLGFLTQESTLSIACFVITFILNIVGLYFYFFKPNKKVGKETEFLNKWGSVILVIAMWGLMIAKIAFIALGRDFSIRNLLNL